jgi:transcriptional regulator with XRE-family HTH domain
MNTRHPLATWRKTQPEPLTQAQLAALLDVEVGTIKNLESGRRGPSLALLNRIETVTGGAVGSAAFVEDGGGGKPAPTDRGLMAAAS